MGLKTERNTGHPTSQRQTKGLKKSEKGTKRLLKKSQNVQRDRSFNLPKTSKKIEKIGRCPA
jgi:phage gp37-like protein